MNKSLLSLAAAAALAGCASGPEVAEEKPAKLGVTQVGQKQNTEYIFCAEGKDCPTRTPKYLPVPKPEPKGDPKTVAPVQAAPVAFKVHFRWGWSALDGVGRKEIDEVVASGALKGAKSITVAGRTDPSGSRSFNEKLAVRRASTVKAALVMAGVPENIIKAEAQAPCCDGDKKAAQTVMRELRRTDITITITNK